MKYDMKEGHYFRNRIDFTFVCNYFFTTRGNALFWEKIEKRIFLTQYVSSSKRNRHDCNENFKLNFQKL